MLSALWSVAFKRSPVPAYLLAALIFLQTPVAGADNSDYRFFDEEGNEVALPEDMVLYSPAHPGPWASVAKLHTPRVKSHMRDSGLEDVRIVEIDIPDHPMKEETLGEIEAIYLLDKDGLIVGYQMIYSNAKKARARFKINGILNYIQIYVFCTKHQGWRFEHRFTS